MSRLSRSLNRTLRQLEGNTKWYDDVLDSLERKLANSPINTFYYNCKAFVRNLPMFFKLAWKWRPWDYSYTIAALVKLLEAQAKCLEKNDRHKNSTKCSRRCYQAAGLLDRAYNRDIDKTISYLMGKNRTFFKPSRDGFYTLEINYITRRKIYDGMYKVARKREENAEKEAKEYAWNFLHKHIETFWD